jgi:hypothetical protein
MTIVPPKISTKILTQWNIQLAASAPMSRQPAQNHIYIIYWARAAGWAKNVIWNPQT